MNLRPHPSRRAQARERKRRRSWACALATVRATLDGASIRLAERNAARKASTRGVSGRTREAAKRAAGGMSGRGARTARAFLRFLAGLLGTPALRDADRTADASTLLRWAGVRGLDGESEVCERTARETFRMLARELPGIVVVGKRGVSLRLRRYTRFAEGLAQVASIDPEIVAAAWKNAQSAAEQAQSADSAERTVSPPSVHAHAGRLEHQGPQNSPHPASTENSPAGCALGCASPAPAEGAGTCPAVSPARASDAPLFPAGSTPCQPRGSRARPVDRVVPTCSRWSFQAPPEARDLIAQSLQGLRPGRSVIGPVAARHPFLELARLLLEPEALARAHASDDGVVESSRVRIRAVAGELRRLARAGRIERDGGEWVVRLAANAVLEFEEIETGIESRPASARMRRDLERRGVPREWTGELGADVARRLQFRLGFEVAPFVCPRLDVSPAGYRWRRAKVQPRRADPRFALRSKIRAAGGAWSSFERSCRAGAKPDAQVAYALACVQLTGRPELAV